MVYGLVLIDMTGFFTLNVERRCKSITKMRNSAYTVIYVYSFNRQYDSWCYIYTYVCRNGYWKWLIYKMLAANVYYSKLLEFKYETLQLLRLI